jgi:hypothetical protein
MLTAPRAWANAKECQHGFIATNRSGQQAIGHRHQNISGLKMPSFVKEITALLVVDPYNRLAPTRGTRLTRALH